MSSTVTLKTGLTEDQIRQITPINDFLLVEKIKEKTNSSIILVKEDRPVKGKVISIGPGEWRSGVFYETVVKPNDIILFKPFAGTTLYDKDDVILNLMKETDVLGIFE